ncbi:MAG TPA: MFS transporter [Actinomycetes bacterium]|nr:MFS transporter [Actinomycetes bacterium]
MTSTGAPGPSPPSDSGADASSSSRRVRLHGWRHPAILAVAAATVAAGFAQFGATSSLGDVARTFGAAGDGTSLVARVGLSGTTLGIGLAIVRLASLASLPLAALADRHGRRRMLLGCVSAGLAVTALAALSPGYWWFVALFAIGRPMLSATNAIAVVVAAEETEARDRAKAIALMTAGYGIGAGLTALVRGAAGGDLGFRGLFALALVPLATIPLLARRLEEPDRYQRLRAASDPKLATARPAVLGRVPTGLRPRLWLLAALAFSIAFVTGPMNTFLFVYAENALGMSRSSTAAMVLAAGPIGLLGLLAGRWAADRLGRRLTAAGTQAMVALAGTLTYSGSRTAVAAGYLVAVLVSSAYAPAFGALGSELFPTRVRATVGGWLVAAGVLGAVAGLVAFGLLTDALDSFATAAVLVCAPVVLTCVLFARVPETRGLELEQSAPD